MDEKIASLLNQLLEGQKKLDSVVEQTTDLIKTKTTVSSKLEDIKDNLSNSGAITVSNWNDITKFKIVK